jgi:hypothetical protein
VRERAKTSVSILDVGDSSRAFVARDERRHDDSNDDLNDDDDDSRCASATNARRARVVHRAPVSVVVVQIVPPAATHTKHTPPRAPTESPN